MTKGYGLTVHDIDMSCPADLKPYLLAYEQEQGIKDRQAWSWIGSYGISALVYAIDHCFNGKQAKTEYVKSPLVDNTQYINTEDSIRQQREAFALKMKTMKMNWDLTHPNKDKDSRN